MLYKTQNDVCLRGTACLHTHNMCEGIVVRFAIKHLRLGISNATTYTSPALATTQIKFRIGPRVQLNSNIIVITVKSSNKQEA